MTPLGRSFAWGIVFLVFGLLAGRSCGGDDLALRVKDAQLKTVTDSLRRAERRRTTVLLEHTAERARADSLQALLLESRHRHTLQDRVLAARTDSLSRLVAVLVTDSATRAAVEQLVESYDARLAGKDSVIAALEGAYVSAVAQVVSFRGDVADANQAALACHAALAQAEAQAAAWHRKARPPWGLALLHDIPKIAVGGAVVLLIQAVR